MWTSRMGLFVVAVMATLPLVRADEPVRLAVDAEATAPLAWPGARYAITAPAPGVLVVRFLDASPERPFLAWSHGPRLSRRRLAQDVPVQAGEEVVLEVRATQRTTAATARLRVELLIEPFPGEPNDTPDTAQPIEIGEDVQVAFLSGEDEGFSFRSCPHVRPAADSPQSSPGSGYAPRSMKNKKRKQRKAKKPVTPRRVAPAPSRPEPEPAWAFLVSGELDLQLRLFVEQQSYCSDLRDKGVFPRDELYPALLAPAALPGDVRRGLVERLARPEVLRRMVTTLSEPGLREDALHDAPREELRAYDAMV